VPHVITENARESAVEAFHRGAPQPWDTVQDSIAVSDDYEIHCRELDLMVELPLRRPDWRRMTAGFAAAPSIGKSRREDLGALGPAYSSRTV